jgi:hypothetical protein
MLSDGEIPLENWQVWRSAEATGLERFPLGKPRLNFRRHRGAFVLVFSTSPRTLRKNSPAHRRRIV